jgi:hypothetical protein
LDYREESSGGGDFAEKVGSSTFAPLCRVGYKK